MWLGRKAGVPFYPQMGEKAGQLKAVDFNPKPSSYLGYPRRTPGRILGQGDEL